MKKTAAVSISLLVLLPLVSFAAINIEKRSNEAILTTSQNIYLVGGAISVFDKVPGDVYAAGGTVSVNADVGRDVVVVGGNLSFTSRITGNLRAAGGNISVSGPVDGDFIVAGGQINIASSAIANGDFIAAGGLVNVDGSLNGNANISANEVHIYGTLNKGADIQANRLIIEKSAVVGGQINYKGSEEAVVNQGAKLNGTIVFTKIPARQQSNSANLAGIIGFLGFVKFLATLVACMVLFFLIRKRITKTAGEALDNFWKELLRGFVLLVVIPVGVLILFVTVLGALIGAFILILYLLMLILGGIFAGIVTAELLNRLIFRGAKSQPLNWWMVILGVIAMGVLSLIPFIGWLVNFAFFLVALGAISNLIYSQAKILTE